MPKALLVPSRCPGGPRGAQGSFWAWGVSVLEPVVAVEGMAVLLPCWPWS